MTGTSDTDRPARWPAAPAAAVLTVCGALSLYVAFATAVPDVDHLQSRGDAAIAAGDHAAATLHFRHLLALEPNEPRHAFALATALDRQKRRGEAMAVLGTVAPVDGVGHAPAHLALAEWTVEARVLGASIDDRALDAAKAHAAAAMRDASLRPQAAALSDVIDGLRAN